MFVRGRYGDSNSDLRYLRMNCIYMMEKKPNDFVWERETKIELPVRKWMEICEQLEKYR